MGLVAAPGPRQSGPANFRGPKARHCQGIGYSQGCMLGTVSSAPLPDLFPILVPIRSVILPVILLKPPRCLLAASKSRALAKGEREQNRRLLG
jgi:hypothetical protein